MHGTLSTALPNLALELHRFVSRIQRPRLRDRLWSREACDRCETLSSELIRVRSEAPQGRLRRGIESMAAALEAYRAELEASPSRSRLQHAYKRLTAAYEDLSSQIRRNIVVLPADVPAKIKTTNYARNLFHVSTGLTALGCYQFLLDRAGALTVLGVMLAIFGTLEVTRRIWPRWNDFLLDHVFRSIARPFERHQVNSATYFLIGTTIAVICFRREAALLGIAVLTFADPAAMLIGMRFGRVRILGEKTLEGTLAFLCMAAVAATAYLLAFAPPEVSTLGRFAIGLSTALIGTTAELFSKRLDDNLTITLACATWAAIWL